MVAIIILDVSIRTSLRQAPNEFVVTHELNLKSKSTGAGWSSLVARRAHNPKVVGSNPAPATNFGKPFVNYRRIKYK